ncbi:MAG: DUF418 domain-containing protein [Gemmataceae bacterium]|nr:DUF418 domain-containing protein [Gemmataceae bacterium]
MSQESPEPTALAEEAQLQPVSAGERLSSVDVLRGFALLGILLMNITSFGFPHNGQADLAAAKSSADPNLAIWIGTSVVFEGKMRAMFSMLFGAGIVLFTLRAEKRQGVEQSSKVFYRRVLWLLALGFLHFNLLWPGDILYEYAVGAFLLFPLRRLSPKLLLLAGLLLLFTGSLRSIPRNWELEQKRVAAAEANAAEAAGKTLTAEQRDAQAEWAARMRWRKPNETQIAKEIADHQQDYWSMFLMRQRQGWAGFVSSWDTAGMMLLGMGLMKLGVFSAAFSIPAYLAMMLLGYTAGFLINSYTAYRAIETNFEPIGLWWNFATYDAGRLTMAMGHIGLLMVIYKAGWLRWLMSGLAAVGQMALTNYLLQSLICTTIFYGYGFGLYGQLERYQLYYVVLGVWIAELIWSPIWLRYFDFGPAEWLWRSLTYWKWQPMRSRARAPVAEEPVASAIAS